MACFLDTNLIVVRRQATPDQETALCVYWQFECSTCLRCLRSDRPAECFACANVLRSRTGAFLSHEAADCWWWLHVQWAPVSDKIFKGACRWAISVGDANHWGDAAMLFLDSKPFSLSVRYLIECESVKWRRDQCFPWISAGRSWIPIPWEHWDLGSLAPNADESLHVSSNSVRVRGTKHILVRGGDVPQRGQLGMGMEGRLSQVAQTQTWASKSSYIGLIQDGAVRCKMSGMADVTSRIFRWSPGDLFRQDHTKLAWVSYCSTYTVVFCDAHSRTKNVQVGRFAKRFTSICCGLPGITWSGAVWCFWVFGSFLCFFVLLLTWNWKWKETVNPSWNVSPSDVRSKTSHELASFVSLAPQLRCKSLQNGSDQVRICMPRWHENFRISVAHATWWRPESMALHALLGLMWPWLKQHAEFSFARFCKHW